MNARTLADIEKERADQDAKWGGPDHDDTHTPSDWLDYLFKHSQMASRAKSDPSEYERQLVRIAALAIAALESHRRNATK